MTSGFTFRAQLVFREQRQIYDYWRSCSHERALPSRGDLEPASMLPFLPYICLIDIRDGFPDAIVRLAGTRLRDIYGFELTGKCLGDLEWGEKTDYWRTVYKRLIDTAEPNQGAIQGPIRKREHITMHWLRLPLSDDGRKVNKILCYDVSVPGSSEIMSGPDQTRKSKAVNS